jgi:hypothetical protein
MTTRKIAATPAKASVKKVSVKQLPKKKATRIKPVQKPAAKAALSPLKKSKKDHKKKVMRAGLKLLVTLNAEQLTRELGRLEKIKTGRPQKH